LTDLDRRLRADCRVHGRAHHGEVELEGIELPRNVDVVGVSRPTRRHDRDVVEAERLAPRLADADVDFH
jgi:hypothetical protein